MRKLLFLCLRLSGIPFLLRILLQRDSVTILCYHDPSPAIVDAHLRLLKERYNFISLRQFIEWRSDQLHKRLPPYAMVLTLDDGHRGNAALASVFGRHRVEPTIFLCSAIIGTNRTYWWKAVSSESECEALKCIPDHERIQQLKEIGFVETEDYPGRSALSNSEINALKGTIDFQCHTRLHPVLPQCSVERVADEIIGSKRELQERFGLEIYALAYPNGSYGDREANLAKKAGYKCALTLDGGYNTYVTDPHRLKRMRISDSAGDNELLVKASGMWEFIQHALQLRRYGYVATSRR